MTARKPMESRTGADFRMLRDKLGVSQQWVAGQVGVTKLTVLTWEDPNEFALPSRKAWDLLEGMWRQADEMADRLVGVAGEAAKAAEEEGRSPAMLLLPYWRNKADYLKSGRDGCMDVENLATRMAQDRLAVLGMPCGITYAQPLPDA